MISNTHRNGFLGLFIGGSALIVSSVTALFKLLSRPQFLVDLYHAIRSAQAHQASDLDLLIIAQVAAALIGVLGAFVVALLLTYYGRPYTVSDENGSRTSS